MSAKNKKNLPIKATKLSVDEISTTTSSVTGTLKLSENLEIGGDGLILSDLLSGSDSKKIISLDSGNLVISTYTDGIRSEHEIILDTNNNISELLNSLNESAMNLEILSLDVTTSGTTGTTAPGDGNARIDGSLSVGTTIGHPNDSDLITLADGSVTFTGTTVIPTADINGGAIDSTTIGATTPAAGTFTTLTANTSLTSAKSLILTPSVITSASTSIGSPTDLDESISVFYFDLNSTSAMYGIFAAGTTGQMINIFYDNNESAGSLRIDFGSTKLRTGSGESRYLTFNITGQSASLMYISTVDKWCVTNTGATVS
jgi:hypothetical protein